jgi:hypothetical protein
MEKKKSASNAGTESTILSVKDLLHLQGAPIVDEKKYVIQAPKVKPPPVVNVSNITEEERRRYFSTNTDDEDSILVEKMHQAVKKIETDVAFKKEQAALQEREAEAEAVQQKENMSSEFDFGPLITSHALKDKL